MLVLVDQGTECKEQRQCSINIPVSLLQHLFYLESLNLALNMSEVSLPEFLFPVLQNPVSSSLELELSNRETDNNAGLRMPVSKKKG